MIRGKGADLLIVGVDHEVGIPILGGDDANAGYVLGKGFQEFVAVEVSC